MPERMLIHTITLVDSTSRIRHLKELAAKDKDYATEAAFNVLEKAAHMDRESLDIACQIITGASVKYDSNMLSDLLNSVPDPSNDPVVIHESSITPDEELCQRVFEEMGRQDLWSCVEVKPGELVGMIRSIPRPLRREFWDKYKELFKKWSELPIRDHAVF